MAVQFAALAAKAWPAVISHGPSLVEKALELYHGTKKTQSALPVEHQVTSQATGSVDIGGLKAAIKDIEGSLLTLNGQATEASLLLSKLAESNNVLSQMVRAQRVWLVALATAFTISFAISLTALILAAL